MQLNSPVKFSLFIVGLIGLIFFIAYQFVPPPPPSKIKIATGREDGAYYNFALQYKEQLAKKFGIELELVSTAGSVAAITALSKGEVDFAFVQGGVAKNIKTIDKTELVSVASLFYEPLWVFYQNSIPTRYLSDLRGKRIAVGELGSGTRPLAIHRLKDNGVTAENSTFLSISSSEAVQSLKKGSIDAAFFISSARSKSIRQLIELPNIELMHFERYKAYIKRYHHINYIDIVQGVINLEKNLPSKDITLISVTAGLLTHKDTNASIIRILLNILQPIHEKGGMLEPSKFFPSADYLELPLHPSAKHFLLYGSSWLEKYVPLSVAMQLERIGIMLIPLLTLLIPLFKSVFPVYRWSIRFKIYRWYRILREIDKEIQNVEKLEIDEKSKVEQLNETDNKIKELKKLRHELTTEKQASVPLSYMSEFYTLRIHINLILQQLQEQRQRFVDKIT